VLAGLVFVAVSINIDRILPVRGLPGRAGESVILLITALIACAFVLVPHQPATALGTELLILGGLVLVLLLLIVTPALRGPSLQPRSWHATRIIGIAAATIPTLLAGASLLHWLPGELYWLVAGVLAALVVGTGNAWCCSSKSSETGVTSPTGRDCRRPSRTTYAQGVPRPHGRILSWLPEPR
jgi:hypothetical protein